MPSILIATAYLLAHSAQDLFQRLQIIDADAVDFLGIYVKVIVSKHVPEPFHARLVNFRIPCEQRTPRDLIKPPDVFAQCNQHHTDGV